MRGSLRLGRIAGIRLEVHWSFLLIILWAIYVGWNQGGTVQSIMWTIAFVMAIFVCIILHELGHSLTARKFDIKTKKITLLPIGGVASLERMPEDPKQELLVAVMGPVVNIVIAGILYFFVRAQLSIFQQPEEVEAYFQAINAQNFLLYLFTTNIVLVLFNIIPAFPMDGGRVLRALLSFGMDRVRATQIAAELGQFIAIMFFFLGLVYNPFLIFIAIFVYFGASGEYKMIRHMSLLKGHKVREAMMTDFTTLDTEDTMEKVGQVLLSGTERHFVVLSATGEVAGLLYNSDITLAFQNHKIQLQVAELINKNFLMVSPTEDLSKIYRTVQGQQHSFFPVMENGQLIGTIDMENINEFMMIQAALDY